MKKKYIIGIAVLLFLTIYYSNLFAEILKSNNRGSMKVLITGFAPFGGEKINPSN